MLGANMKHVENKTCLLSGHLLWLDGVWVFGAGCQHDACGEQDLSAVWSSPLVVDWVFGAGCQHEACGDQDLSAVWSSPTLVVDWVFSAGCQHEACGEQDLSAVWSSPLVGVWVFGAGCQDEASLLHPGKVAYMAYN